MKLILFTLLFIIIASCNAPEFTKEKSVQHAKVTDSIETPKAPSIDSLWHELVYEKGDCLTGRQRVVNGRFGNKLCVLTSKNNATQADWSPFFNHPKEELTAFLVSQLADTTKTRIHTCPFFVATTGEVAVYCLSNIHLKNWYDLAPFVSYQDRKPTNSIDGEQAWLQAILANDAQREKMIAEWKKQ